jgi:opacity protein-like surface antigen
MKNVFILVVVLLSILVAVSLAACSGTVTVVGPSGEEASKTSLITQIQENPRQWEGRQVTLTGSFISVGYSNEFTLFAEDGSTIRVRYNGEIPREEGKVRDVEVVGRVTIQTMGAIEWPLIEASSWRYTN